MLKSLYSYCILDEIQGSYTVVFFTADTCSTSKERASYKSSEAGTWCREPRLAVITHFRSVINHTCSDIVFLLHLPFPSTMQDYLPKGLHKYFHKDKRMYLCEQFGPAHDCNLVANNPVITIYRALVCTAGSSQCTTWTPFR